jgi:hypothetical protein
MSHTATAPTTILTRSGAVSDVFTTEADRDEAVELAEETRFGTGSAPAPILWSVRDLKGRTWYGFSFSTTEMPEGIQWM